MSTSSLLPTSLQTNTSILLQDYFYCCLSRELSISIRREVLTGKAKFGVSDDGKELAQIAMAKVFRKGDYRADYYRGMTLPLALEIFKPEDVYAQLYADHQHDPFSAGRQMINHHATPFVHKDGSWADLAKSYNLSSDISTTAGQMARGLGLALASKHFRADKNLRGLQPRQTGDEVTFCIIGDASTSEGAFWETINAAGVMQVPLLVSVFDDGYGISVPKELQTTKSSISDVLSGFEPTEEQAGVRIFRVAGWNYERLCAVYQEAADYCRENHAPVLVHVEEMTQPQGHSTSGSHERYKSKQRLAWEAEHDCLTQFETYLLTGGYATEAQLKEVAAQAEAVNKQARQDAYRNFRHPIRAARKALDNLYQAPVFAATARSLDIRKAASEFLDPDFTELIASARKMTYALRGVDDPKVDELHRLLQSWLQDGAQRYKSHLFSETERAALKVPVVPAQYSPDSPELNGFQILNTFFEQALAHHNNLYAFGEDVGQIGGVNQGFSGLQAKYGKHRVFDTGIREWTIIGQAIGMAMRGLRPMAEIQYLDYLIYAMSPLSDDLATLRWRSAGQQIAPAIIRTRGHRLEGVWHSGSPMGLLLSGLRGIYICTPRNMTQAAGMYQTLLQSDDPGLVIECLNGYRLKERLPENISTFTVPLGVPEVLQSGTDLTLLTYGSCVRVAEEAITLLEADGISVELIDAQTLLPFDLEHQTVASLAKTNRLVILDEDVPGGASAYLLREVMEVQGGYQHLDSAPLTISAEAHRPAYGSDGDYFSKPNPETVYERILEMMMEAEPERF